MSGIYLHIPFCKQACHYCDFHFSTSLKKKDAMIEALCKELILRKHEQTSQIKTIYFGGGTPSVLQAVELKQILDTIHTHYKVDTDAEVTLEANPDDFVSDAEDRGLYLKRLRDIGFNRLSIGVQSFFEEDLKLMNRAHNAEEAHNCIEIAKRYFDNLSIDLIYGIPKMTPKRWKENLHKALSYEIPHLSCYALTVEPNTALAHFIKKGKVEAVDDEEARKHHKILVDVTEERAYENYEFSNFALEGWHSQNNTAYWQGKSYLGIGPSAHSYNGLQRSWNVANNTKYIDSINKGDLPITRETLSLDDRYNEYVMTRLRTKKGIDLNEIEENFGPERLNYLLEQATEHLRLGVLEKTDHSISVTRKGAFLTDGIASNLFFIAE
jgi:oxygen-independent coproporphyrinogen III oxidase